LGSDEESPKTGSRDSELDDLWPVCGELLVDDKHSRVLERIDVTSILSRKNIRGERILTLL
jgi:hypothetical protein